VTAIPTWNIQCGPGRDVTVDLARIASVARGNEPHPPSTGLFERGHWPMGGHSRDCFAVMPDAARCFAAIEMDAATGSSDQPPSGRPAC
jgi:hypothetical protein